MTANLGIYDGLQRPLPSDPIFETVGSIVGQWAMPQAFWVTASSSDNTLHAVPFVVPVTRNFDAFGINITTAAAAGNTATLGVYSSELFSGFRWPDRLLQFGEVATDATGTQTATLAPFTLNAGIYWLASHATVGFSSTTTSHTSPSPFSWDNHGGVPGTNVTTFRGGFILSATEMPNLWSIGSGTPLNRYVRLIGIRAAS